ncbi:MAG: hypothetical protein NW207_12125 [Cytophagales bacterium]|nr:hypothetical protein [Cytophagales bacterium]
MSVNIYLSTDNTFSISDYYLDQYSLYFYTGTNTNSDDVTIPSSIPSGTYYVLARYQKNTGGEYYVTSSTQQVMIGTTGTCVFYRNTSNSIYTYKYLFINDEYKDDLYYYSSSGVPSNCTSINSITTYKFTTIPGTYTYKIMSQNSLTQGTVLKTGSITITDNGCVFQDID